MTLFDKKASTYDDWCDTPLGNFVSSLESDIITGIAQPIAKETVLDIGCGTGTYSIKLANTQLEVTGLDISDEMLKQASKKASLTAHEITFINGDFHVLPFKDQVFDLVITNITLEFVNQPDLAISEAMRVLKKGGRFIAGFIGKNSTWGKNYQQKGKNDSNSVFSKASFFTEKEIKSFYKYEPDSLNYYLYISSNEYNNDKQAMELEMQRRRIHPTDEAGFIVAKWTKKS